MGTHCEEDPVFQKETIDSMLEHSVSIFVSLEENETQLVELLRQHSGKNGLLVNVQVPAIKKALARRQPNICFTSEFQLSPYLQAYLDKSKLSVIIIRTPESTGKLLLSGNLLFKNRAAVEFYFDLARPLCNFGRPFSHEELINCVQTNKDNISDILKSVGCIKKVKNKVHNLALNTVFWDQLSLKRKELFLRISEKTEAPNLGEAANLDGISPSKFYSVKKSYPVVNVEKKSVPMKRKRPAPGKTFDLRLRPYRAAKEFALSLANPKDYLQRLPCRLSKKIEKALERADPERTKKGISICRKKCATPRLTVSENVEFYAVVFDDVPPIGTACLEFAGHPFTEEEYNENLQEYFKGPTILYQPSGQILLDSDSSVCIIQEKEETKKAANQVLEVLLATPADKIKTEAVTKKT